MSEYKVVNENVITVKGVTFNKRYNILNSDNGLALFVNDEGESRLRNPDADPSNELTVEYNPNNDELAPCFHCNI